MKQVSIFDIETEHKPRKCPNCIYWELLPKNEQPKYHNSYGWCGKHSEKCSFINGGCEFYQEWTEEPYWRKYIKSLDHYRCLEYISLLECKYKENWWEHEVIQSKMRNWEKYWTKYGIEVKQEEL